MVVTTLGLTYHCGLHLPTYCPVERGAPLHLYLHQYLPHDPWNDPPPEPAPAWGLVDLRRLAQPPRPAYVMLQLPSSFDLQWLRDAFAATMPELPPVAAAYMGADLIVEQCVPAGNTPLLTLFPGQHCVFETQELVTCILDTHALLDLRPGFNNMVRVNRARERQVPVNPRGQPTSVAAGSRGTLIPSHLRLAPVYDEDAREYCSEELFVYCPGQTPRLVTISRLCRPDELLRRAASAIGLTGASTLHIPTVAPLVTGHTPSVAVIPSHLPGDRHFLLVDARRVSTASLHNLWLQEAPAVLSPLILLAALRRAAPHLGPMGHFYFEGMPMRGYTELTARVTLVTILPEHFDVCNMPTPLYNRRALRVRPGLQQLDCRYRNTHHRRRDTTTTTTTSAGISDEAEHGSTTTTTQPPVPDHSARMRGAFVQSTADRWISFYLAVPGGHTVSATLTGQASMAEVMTQLCVLLLNAGHLRSGLRFRTCDRVFSDYASGMTVFFSLSDGQGSDVAWIDASPLGIPPSVVALPWRLTVDTLWAFCQGRFPHSLPLGLRVTVNGVPWDGEPRDLQYWDVVSVRRHFHELFSLPLHALETRIEGISALLIPQPGPTEAIAVIHDGLSGDMPMVYGNEPFNRDNLHTFWSCAHISWHMSLCLEGGYECCVLASADVPPFRFTAATRVAPCPEHVNMWYRTHMQRTFGSRFWQESGLAYGSTTVMFDSSLHSSGRCAWVFCISEDIDVVIADTERLSLASWPAPEGWVLRPVFTMAPSGRQRSSQLTLSHVLWNIATSPSRPPQVRSALDMTR